MKVLGLDKVMDDGETGSTWQSDWSTRLPVEACSVVIVKRLLGEVVGGVRIEERVKETEWPALTLELNASSMAMRVEVL